MTSSDLNFDFGQEMAEMVSKDLLTSFETLLFFGTMFEYGASDAPPPPHTHTKPSHLEATMNRINPSA